MYGTVDFTPGAQREMKNGKKHAPAFDIKEDGDTLTGKHVPRPKNVV